MTERMIRKQVYLTPEQARRLNELAERRGVSQAEVIRQALRKETVEAAPKPEISAERRAAWEAILRTIEERKKLPPGEPVRWTREALYEERESRWLRDRE